MLDRELTYAVADGAHADTLVLTLTGPLTLSNMFKFQDDLRAMKPACLILDMTGVPYIDSAGLGVLMNSYVAADGDKRKFLLSGVNDRVRALLEMTKVDQILKIYSSVEAAEVAAAS